MNRSWAWNDTSTGSNCILAVGIPGGGDAARRAAGVARKERKRRMTPGNSATGGLFDFKSWRDLTPMNISVGSMRHNKTGTWRFIRPFYENKVPACRQGCPAGNNIESWVSLILDGDFEGACRRLKLEQPFPAVLGRICFRFCQDSCNRNALDRCVQINALERFLGDQVPSTALYPEPADYNGKSLAVVGSGPAGMANAYFARLLGYNVTIFEKHPEPGGILRMGIPAYRLPREIVAAEFDGLGAMGITIHTYTEIGRDITLSQLSDTFDYVFLATGVHRSIPLGIPGEHDTERVMSGLDLLKRVACDDVPDIGGRVMVIGGGNTAVDAARTALRLGAEVTVVYRRTEAEMPAHEDEVNEALEEGVRFLFLAAPVRIDVNPDGGIARVACCEMRLGEQDESGRRRPIVKEGSQFELDADTVITAVGEQAGFSYLEGAAAPERGALPVDSGGRALVGSTFDRLYAGGDIIDIPHTAVHAVAAGKRAAIAMDCELKGLDLEDVLGRITIGNGPGLSFEAYRGLKQPLSEDASLKTVVKPEDMVFDYFRYTRPVEIEITPATDRKTSFQPYRSSLTARQARLEAERCMHCGRCTCCDNCLIFCPDMAVHINGNGSSSRCYTIDYDYCKGCGICAAECPRCAITMVKEEALSA